MPAPDQEQHAARIQTDAGPFCRHMHTAMFQECHAYLSLLLFCRDAVHTGVYAARLKRRKLDIDRVELLASMRGDSPGDAYTAAVEPPGD